MLASTPLAGVPRLAAAACCTGLLALCGRLPTVAGSLQRSRAARSASSASRGAAAAGAPEAAAGEAYAAATKQIGLTINGREVHVPEGSSILPGAGMLEMCTARWVHGVQCPAGMQLALAMEWIRARQLKLVLSIMPPWLLQRTRPG